MHDASGRPHTSFQRREHRRRLGWTLGLTASFMVAEAVGGWLTGSLALLADAGHMLSDVAALSLGLFASWIALRPPTPQRSFGYLRSEILAALAQGALLVTIAIFVWSEAIERLGERREILGAPMTAVAALGLLVNLCGLWLLSGGRHESLNVRGAWLHVLSDALGSVGAIVAGVLVWQLGWTWADPAASLLIGTFIVYSAWNLLREAVAVLLESAPGHIDVDAVQAAISGVPGVRAVHDLHVWSIHTGLVSLSCHVTVPDPDAGPRVLRELCRLLESRFGIGHVTIQIEHDGFEECRVETAAGI